jgi:hypothetical protein
MSSLRSNKQDHVRYRIQQKLGNPPEQAAKRQGFEAYLNGLTQPVLRESLIDSPQSVSVRLSTTQQIMIPAPDALSHVLNMANDFATRSKLQAVIARYLSVRDRLPPGATARICFSKFSVNPSFSIKHGLTSDPSFENFDVTDASIPQLISRDAECYYIENRLSAPSSESKCVIRNFELEEQMLDGDRLRSGVESWFNYRFGEGNDIDSKPSSGSSPTLDTLILQQP